MRAKIDPVVCADLSEQLPEVHSFVDIAVGDGRRRESVPINDITTTTLVARRPRGLQAGDAADFLYANEAGRFRFSATCVKFEGTAAYFTLPAAIQTVQSFNYRRVAPRVAWILPLHWRCAFDGAGYGEFLAASLMDISSSGAALVVARDVRLSAQVELRFTLKAGSDPFVERCRVVRAVNVERSGKIIAGVRFVDMTVDGQRRLIRCIDERQTLRRNRGVV